MFCRECGANNDDSASVCVQCGAAMVATVGQNFSNPSSNPYSASGSAGLGVQMPGNLPPKPQNYLVQSILVTLCCCMPGGIVAIVYSAQVDGKWNQGDFQGALNCSKLANRWGIASFVAGILAIIAGVALQILVGVAAQMQ